MASIISRKLKGDRYMDNNGVDIIINEKSNSSDILYLLKGEGKYYKHCYDGPMPCEPTKVIECYLDMLFIQPFRDNFIGAIKLLSRDSVYSWLSLYYLFNLVRFSEENSIDIDLPRHLIDIEKGILENKKSLEKDFRWLGWMWPNGLWGDVMKITKTMEELHNIKFKLIRASE
jgi:hypothetical protein